MPCAQYRFWNHSWGLPGQLLANFQGHPTSIFGKINICSEDDLRSRIFRTFVAKFLACLPLLEFSNI